jgi:hypothetical protein
MGWYGRHISTMPFFKYLCCMGSSRKDDKFIREKVVYYFFAYRCIYMGDLCILGLIFFWSTRTVSTALLDTLNRCEVWFIPFLTIPKILEIRKECVNPVFKTSHVAILGIVLWATHKMIHKMDRELWICTTLRTFLFTVCFKFTKKQIIKN